MHRDHSERVADAKMWWGLLLTVAPEKFDAILANLRWEMRLGVSFKEIEEGASEAKIRELEVKKCKALALKWLNLARKGGDHVLDYIKYFYAQIKKGGLSLADLETKKEELDELVHKAVVVNIPASQVHSP